MSVFGRSLFMQSVWNPRRMQNVGFCFALMPVLRRKGLDRSARREFLERHLGFFNTNPVLASYVLGSAARAEMEAAPRSGDAGADVQDVKRGLAAPVATIGDALLWASLRPLAGLVGCALAIEMRLWAPVVLLLIYNVPSLYLRARGLAVGLRKGPSGVRELTGPRVRTVVAIIRGGAAFTGGLVLAMAVGRRGAPDLLSLIVVAAFFAVSLAAARFRVPVTLVAAGCAIAGAVLASIRPMS
jgi:PTS system mannose-specific IID component